MMVWLEQQHTAVVVNDDGQVLVATLVGDLVDSDPTQVGEPVRGRLGVDNHRGMNGEIMLRGRSLFSGYWNNPEATEAAFVDGWFRTGDVGYTDEDGYFYIVDRIKNIVIVGSSNVYPADLEKVLDDCPEIAESAVVGCPDPDTGEALVACVKPRELGGLSEREVRSLFVGRLAEYQHPKHVLFIDTFPRTSLGKVQKAELSRLVRDVLVQEPSGRERQTPPQAPLGAAP